MTVIINSEISVPNVSVAQPLDIVKLSSTLALIIYESGARLKAATISIDGTTLELNAERDIDALSGSADEAVLVALTSTSAMVIYESTNLESRILTISGTTVVPNANTTLTDSVATISSLSACFISSTKVLFVYNHNTDGQGNAVVLSVAGTTITENGIITFGSVNDISSTKCASYSTTRAIVTYLRALGADNIYGIILSISGNTLFANTEKQIVSGTAAQGIEDTYCIQMTSTQACYGNLVNTGNFLNNYVLTLNGTTFDVGAVTTATQTVNNNVSAAKLTDTSLIVVNETSSNTFEAFKYNITGVGNDELTLDGSDSELITGLDTIRAAPINSTNVITFSFITTAGEARTISTTATEFTIAPMRKPCDINADGNFLYIAALDASGQPALLKIATSLDADASSVFAPGAGDNIGVECGRFDADVVYVAGNFDGTNVVEKSSDAGSSFAAIDDGTIGDVRAFVVGPDNDNRILVFDETNGDILETTDAATWTAINASVTPEINAIARLGRNVQECVFGNDAAASNSINYSPNSGDDLEDFQTGDYPQASATRVIVI